MPTVLIADDVPANIRILGELLRDHYEVLVAGNGQRAVQLAEEKLPDLILLDVMMPEMDGFAACSVLKSRPQTAAIPVVFITARTDEEDILRGFEAGAVDYLTKPFRPREVLVRVQTHVELKRARDGLRATVEELRQALAEVRQLSGLLPICSFCKKIRNDTGYWANVDAYISEHSGARFSHGICPACMKEHYPEYADDQTADPLPPASSPP